MPTTLSERWRANAIKVLETAKRLLESDDYRSCVSRAYYATYKPLPAYALTMVIRFTFRGLE